MASTTCSMKPVQRSKGQSATASAAYRAGAKIEDENTGEVHDYRRKGGVVSAEIMTPDGAPEWMHDRQQLWNHAEATETRGNARVAREFLVGLPAELDDDQRQEVAREFTQALVDRYGFAADICIHRPDREGDQRNHHAHILCTTREVGPDGLGAKTRMLDDKTQGPKETKWFRQKFEEITNAALERAGHETRIDMRSYKDQGKDQEPQQHMGPTATAIMRRDGDSRIAKENRERQERNQEAEHLANEVLDNEAAEAFLEVELEDVEGEIIALEHEREQHDLELQMIDVRRFLSSPAPAPEAQPRKKQTEKPAERDSTRKPTPTLDDFENVLESPTEPEIDPNDLNARLHGPGYVPKAPEPEIDPNDMNALYRRAMGHDRERDENDLPPPPEPEPDDDFGPSMG